MLFSAPIWVWWTSVRDRSRRRDGQALVEYALIIALVAIGALAALHFLSGSANNTMDGISNNITNSVGP
jgi:pilus assembly protein Flp/PilA